MNDACIGDECFVGHAAGAAARFGRTEMEDHWPHPDTCAALVQKYHTCAALVQEFNKQDC